MANSSKSKDTSSGLGMVSGAAAGAAAGSLFGPIGAAVGAVVGGVTGARAADGDAVPKVKAVVQSAAAKVTKKTAPARKAAKSLVKTTGRAAPGKSPVKSKPPRKKSKA